MGISSVGGRNFVKYVVHPARARISLASLETTSVKGSQFFIFPPMMLDFFPLLQTISAVEKAQKRTKSRDGIENGYNGSIR